MATKRLSFTQRAVALLTALIVLVAWTTAADYQERRDVPTLGTLSDVVVPVASSYEFAGEGSIHGFTAFAPWFEAQRQRYVDPCAHGLTTNPSRDELRRRFPGRARNPRAPPRLTS